MIKTHFIKKSIFTIFPLFTFLVGARTFRQKKSNNNASQGNNPIIV